ncbi:MAG: efflux RND transporter permease subunit [Alphaproteobacteria bacterium]|nr:efflux RND transporter permease subunit [Alphaproteobacteria bacterium]
MLKFFVRRPITTLMFVLVWVLLGLVAYPRMNIERTPSLDFPMVTATFVYPGASSDEIESQVIKKAEDAISEVPGIKHITSRIFENGGYIMTEFNLGVDANDKAAEVKTKIDALASVFPDDLKQPVVEKLNPLQQAVVDIVLRGPSATEIDQYIDDVLANKITAIDGVAKVTTFGGRERAIRVAMDPDLMAARGVTIMDVITALGNKNLNVPGGKIEYAASSQNVRFIGEFASVDEIANLPISTSEGIRFKLSDVASITDAARDIEKGARYNGTDVVVASVEKANDGNAIKISRALRKKLPELNADFAAHFPNAETQIEIISDSSTTISDDTNDTINGIILGVIFTVLVLLAFTRNWRSTVIAGVVIPASLIAGFEFMSASGFTINAITLLAYSSALGTLVSNAIILIESALQEMRAGKDSETAAIDGTKRVAVSVLAGVGTNVVVFLPLAFMGGIVGKFMIQFGLTVVYLTLLSLVFSFTLTPMMIAKFLRLTKENKQEIAKKDTQKKSSSWLHRWFEYQMLHAGRVVGMAFLVLFGSMLLTNFIGNEFQPSTDANEITITARAPMGATYEKSLDITNQIEQRLVDIREVKSLTAKIGNEGLQNINIRVELIDKSKRFKSDKKLAQEMLPMLNDIPDAEIQIRAGEAMSSISSDIVLNIYGEDDGIREGYAKQIIAEINNIEEIQSAVLAQQTPSNEVRFIPDAEKMDFWGVKNSYAGTVLRYALYGNDTYKYKENGNEYPIIVEFAKTFKTQNLFDVVYANSPKGMVALSQLGTAEIAPATPDIRRLDKNRLTEIDINIGKSTLGPVQKKIESVLRKMDWQTGYSYSFGGMSEIQDDTTGEIGQAFLLASILTFMLLAAILNSLIHPLTMATAIITSFAGVFVVLFLSGASMNIGAMLAFVMLVGLVVNNSILVLEPAINRIRRGEKVADALWAELTERKNMVLMTSIAVVAGMAPQLFGGDGMKTAMAAVMIGGMLASMVWTFTLTPALFVVMEKCREKISGKK